MPGIIDIGDGDAAIFKMESHNHPSYIEPYQGAATGVGGILRDVFTMGARPIANLNALRFGRPDHPKTRHLIAGVVAGIGGYGNCVGVPTVGGEVNFDAAYDGNILVNAMTVGVAKTDKIFYSAATGIGNPIVYVGSKTGRDGIHGATMASADFGEDSEEKRPTVQVGDPFTEKLLIEACLELMATDAIVAIQDMGAAGLTSSSVEMASKGGAGIRLDMNKVPCRETGMTPYEMMLSESQERMLMVLKPGREGEAEAIFRKWELDFAVIGEVTDTGHMVLEFDGEVVCDIPLGPLADDAPCYERPHMSLDEYKAWAQVKPLGEVPESTDIAADLLKLMASPNLASRRWIWEQYDQSVGGDTVQRPGGDAAVVRVHGTTKALAMTTDCTPRYVYADPYEGGKQAIAEAYRNLCAVGAGRWRSPTASTSATRSGPRSWPSSSSASRHGRRLPGARFPDRERQRLASTTKARRRRRQRDPAHAGDRRSRPARRLGEERDDRFQGGGRAHPASAILDRPCRPVPVARRDPRPARRAAAAASISASSAASASWCGELIAEGLVTAVHDVSDGGLLVAVAEMALAGNIGARPIDVCRPVPNPAAIVFGEDQGRYVGHRPAIRDAVVGGRRIEAELFAVPIGDDWRQCLASICRSPGIQCEALPTSAPRTKASSPS